MPLVLHGGVLPAGRCERCTFRHEFCLCAEVPRVETRTRVVVLRHYSERFRSSNSGRLAHLALPNSELRDVFGPEGRGEGPIGDGAWLLFPGSEPRTASPAPPPRELIVLDATWHQARRMRQRMAGLHRLPVLSLAPLGAVARMRKSPQPGRVSTLEAIAAALRLLEGPEVGEPLEQLFECAVDRVRRSGRMVHGTSAPPDPPES